MSLGTALLTDAFRTFGVNEHRLASREVVRRIAANYGCQTLVLPDGMPLTQHRLAYYLRKVDCTLRPRVLRIGDKLARGYYRDEVERVYLLFGERR